MAESATEAAETQTTGAVPTGKQRPNLPDGIVSPIAALNHLKTHKHPEGHAKAGQHMAAQDFKPQQMYGFVKNPGKTDPFPVKHFDAEGNEYDAPQVNEHGITTTRPGVRTEEVVDWWGRKDERDKARAEERAAKAKAKAEKEAAKAAKAAETSTTEASGDEADTEAEDSEYEDVSGDLEADELEEAE